MLVGLVMLIGQSSATPDRRIAPPVERTFASATGHYRLRISTPDAWRTREPLAELRRDDRIVWSRRLPNSHGPRDAVVLDTGGVVLLDEWINIASSRAITVLGAKGEEAAVFGYDAIRVTLGVSSDALSDAALKGAYGRGTWLAGHPVLQGRTIEMPAGGRTLILDLARRRLRNRA